jgi:SAM-dependent methyltransferase
MKNLKNEINLFNHKEPDYKSSLSSVKDYNLKDTISFFDSLNNDKSHFMTNDDFCTPMSCVIKMLDYIPKDFWGNKLVRVLDPCAGNGNFGAYLRFLTKEDNIWYNEISEIRYKNLISLLNPKNVRLGDGLNLTDSFSGEWDLIVANPPYSGGSNKNKSLSNKFIINSINILRHKGYLCFITPNNWMTYNNNNITLKRLLQEGSFVVIDNDAKKYFPKIGSSFTIFIWQKGVLDHKTTVYNSYLIKDLQKDVSINPDLMFIPLYISNESLSLSAKCIEQNRNSFNYRCDLHNFTQKSKLNDEKIGDFIYPTIHTKKKLRYSNMKQDIFDKWLIIIPLSTYFIPYLVRGFNVTQSVGYFSFENEEEAKVMLDKLKQKYVKVLVHLTRYGNFNNIKVLKHLKIDGDLNFLKNEILFVDNLYKLINY